MIWYDIILQGFLLPWDGETQADHRVLQLCEGAARRVAPHCGLGFGAGVPSRRFGVWVQASGVQDQGLSVDLVLRGFWA